MLDSVQKPEGVRAIRGRVPWEARKLSTAGASRDVRHAKTLRRTQMQQVHSARICVGQRAGARGDACNYRLGAPGGAQVVAGVEDEAAAAHQPADLVHQLRGLVLLERACQHPMCMHSGPKPCLRVLCTVPSHRSGTVKARLDRISRKVGVRPLHLTWFQACSHQKV